MNKRGSISLHLVAKLVLIVVGIIIIVGLIYFVFGSGIEELFNKIIEVLL